MKKLLFTALCVGIAILACNIIACNKEKTTQVVTPKNNALPHMAGRNYADSVDTAGSKFISVSVANEMIGSYLYSINSGSNDTDLRSFSVNLDSLKAYLSGTNAKSIKLIFAHTMAYINAGNYGVNAGYQSGAITLIIAAYDSAGNYVYYNGSNVLDHLAPCPYSCPPGNAGNTLLE